MDDTSRNMRDIINEYIEQRDAMIAKHRGKGGTFFGNATPSQGFAFDGLIVSCAARFARAFTVTGPDLNLAQWEAFSELATSHLNEIRRRMHPST